MVHSLRHGFDSHHLHHLDFYFMNEIQAKIIKESINDSFDERKKAYDFVINDNSQLLLSQFDLFKVLGGLVVGLSSIGYLYGNQNLDSFSLFLSLVFWLAVLILSVSYTRETIDNRVKENDEILSDVLKKTWMLIDKAVESLKTGDEKIYFNFVESQIDTSDKKISKKSYIWEIVVFCFYSALAFILTSFFFNPYLMCGKISLVLLVFSVAWFFAFSNWVTWLFSRK